MFHLKICGVLVKSDIEAAADAGADCVGLNFFPESVRYVEPDSLETLALAKQARSRGLLRAGIFVNYPGDEMTVIAQGLDLDVVQLHGDESIEDAEELRDLGIEVVKAVCLPPGQLTVDQVTQATQKWVDAGFHMLLDAESGESFGGSGKTLDWKTIAKWAEQHPDVLWTLAGGLNPSNIADAIKLSGAKSVDVASGVEQPRGTKNAGKIAEFCRAAKAAMSCEAES